MKTKQSLNSKNLRSLRAITSTYQKDAKILAILVKHGPQTRGQLVTKTGIARSTIWDAVERLNTKEMVKSYSEEPNGRAGRPRVFFEAL